MLVEECLEGSSDGSLGLLASIVDRSVNDVDASTLDQQLGCIIHVKVSLVIRHAQVRAEANRTQVQRF